LRAAAREHPSSGWLEWLRTRAGHGDADALSALRNRIRPVVPISGAPEMLLPTGRRHVEPRRAEQPEHNARRDSAERGVGTRMKRGWRR
jgi:hypothetical protein